MKHLSGVKKIRNFVVENLFLLIYIFACTMMFAATIWSIWQTTLVLSSVRTITLERSGLGTPNMGALTLVELPRIATQYASTSRQPAEVARRLSHYATDGAGVTKQALSSPDANRGSTNPLTSPPDSLADDTIHHVVRGDSLWGLAKRYRTSVPRIKRANGLTGNIIRPGDLLHIPKEDP